MAKKTIEKFYSDLSNTEIDKSTPTVRFAFDGTDYEIDLTSTEKSEFAAVLGTYISAGRKVTSARRTAKAPAYDAKAVRAWAKANKVDVPARGRIPASVLNAYNAAH
jgi:hypothetical protein